MINKAILLALLLFTFSITLAQQPLSNHQNTPYSPQKHQPDKQDQSPSLGPSNQQPGRQGLNTSPTDPEYCYSDQYYAHRSSQNPTLDQARSNLDRDIYLATVAGQANPNNRAGTILNVPTVVHIIHNNGAENIPNSQVINAINEINMALRNQGYYNPNTGVDVEIELCLANQDPNGNASDGINRVVSPLTDFTMETQDLDLKNLSRWDPTVYLNIWVVNGINSQFSGSGVLGYSTFPTSHGAPNDGFVVEYPYFGGTQDNNKVSVHELGHYLGLYHVFQDGCTNNDCQQNGDRVCDTPPDGTTARPPCTSTPNSCNTDEDDTSTNNPFRPVALGGLGDQPDLFQDYMDYSQLNCMNVFTEGQKERMRLSLQIARQSLLQGNRCLPPCPQPVSASFTSPGTTVPFGGSLSFTNTSTGGTLYDWKINGQSFSTATNSSYTFNTTGFQSITLVAQNGIQGCIDSFTVAIEVVCQAQASFTNPSGQLQPGQSVIFTNTSTGASSQSWFVEGLAAGSAPNLSYTFPLAGTYQIELVVSNGNCTDTMRTSIQVGFCNDLTYSQWRFGDYVGIDFTSGTATLVTNSAMRAFEASASISDQNGDLLFYTNGGPVGITGNYSGGVWNRNNVLMPNGSLGFNDNGCTSARQSSIILPHPGNSDQYFVFVNSCAETGFTPGFSYHLVDMTLDNGLGDVILKNQFILDNQNEAMAAVRHCNGSDYWLAAIDQPNANLNIYLLDANGLNLTPQGVYPLMGIATPDFLKFSPDGTKVAYINFVSGTPSRDLFLFDFDNATGVLSFREDLDIFGVQSGDFDFSSNSRYLFVLGSDGNPLLQYLHQYDTDANPIGPTLNLTNPPLNNSSVARFLQLAPDGKIYGSALVANILGSIDFPNQAGATYQPSTLTLPANATNGAGLVCVPASSFFDPTPQIGGSTVVCAGDQLGYTLQLANSCGSNGTLWDYRGGGTLVSMTNTTSTILFGNAGNDTLIATNLATCSSLSDTILITVGTGVPFNLGPDLILCGGSITLDAGPGFASYWWNTSATSQSINTSSPGTYWVEVVDQNGCTQRDTTIVQGNPGPPSPNLGPDTTYCDNILVLYPGPGFTSYLWQDNTTDSTHTAYQAGTYTVEVTGPCGEVGRDTVEIFPCVGVAEAVALGDLKVFPNPNQGTFQVEIEFKRPQNELRMELVDQMGRVVWNESVDKPGRAWNGKIELADLSSGIYLFRVSTPNGNNSRSLRVR